MTDIKTLMQRVGELDGELELWGGNALCTKVFSGHGQTLLRLTDDERLLDSGFVARTLDRMAAAKWEHQRPETEVECLPELTAWSDGMFSFSFKPPTAEAVLRLWVEFLEERNG